MNFVIPPDTGDHSLGHLRINVRTTNGITRYMIGELKRDIMACYLLCAEEGSELSLDLACARTKFTLRSPAKNFTHVRSFTTDFFKKLEAIKESCVSKNNAAELVLCVETFKDEKTNFELRYNSNIVLADEKENGSLGKFLKQKREGEFIAEFERIINRSFPSRDIAT